MEKENNGSSLSGRRNPRAVLPSPSPSPQLCRSKSGSNLASIVTTPENNSSRRFGSSQRFVNNSNRSKSTSRTRRTRNNEENIINPTPIANISSTSRKSRESNNNNGISRDRSVGASKRATLKSPSAWALSPGRFLGSPAVSESPRKVKNNDSDSGGSGGGSMSKVLKYFRQKKASSVQEEYHRFRILHTRLLQWRFANARAENAMANVKKAAEADVESVYEAMIKAIEVMDSVDPLIRKHQKQVERILYQVTELTAISKQLEEYSHELLIILPMIATSAENEKSIMVHLIQTTKMEFQRGQRLCNAQSCI